MPKGYNAKSAKHLGDWEQRFWARVQTGPITECWPWLGRKTRGYGQMWFAGADYRVIRLVWFLVYGMFPPSNTHILHTCDNPPCANPSHLFAGNAKANAEDARSKGRIPSKLTLTEIQEIRQQYAQGLRPQGDSGIALAKRLGISIAHLRRIVVGEDWPDVD